MLGIEYHMFMYRQCWENITKNHRDKITDNLFLNYIIIL